jgi:hypothetical protein
VVASDFGSHNEMQWTDMACKCWDSDVNVTDSDEDGSSDILYIETMYLKNHHQGLRFSF